jgi:hypothetical protein
MVASQLGIEDGLKQHFERFFETGAVAGGTLAITLRFDGKHSNGIAVWAWGHGSTSYVLLQSAYCDTGVKREEFSNWERGRSHFGICKLYGVAWHKLPRNINPGRKNAFAAWALPTSKGTPFLLRATKHSLGSG